MLGQLRLISQENSLLVQLKLAVKNSYKIIFPGKFHKAVFEIQKVVANEFVTGTTKENLEERLKDLEVFLKVATRGGSIDFARATLAKGLFVVMQVSG